MAAITVTIHMARDEYRLQVQAKPKQQCQARKRNKYGRERYRKWCKKWYSEWYRYRYKADRGQSIGTGARYDATNGTGTVQAEEKV